MVGLVSLLRERGAGGKIEAFRRFGNLTFWQIDASSLGVTDLAHIECSQCLKVRVLGDPLTKVQPIASREKADYPDETERDARHHIAGEAS